MPPPVQVWVRLYWRLIRNIVDVYTLNPTYGFMRTSAGMDSIIGAAIEINDVTAMDIIAGSVSIEAINAGLGAYLEHPRTPRTESSSSVAVSCKETFEHSTSSTWFVAHTYFTRL